MQFLIISGSPKQDGLCHGVTAEVRRGALDGGAAVETLTVEKLERCHVCGTGWGSCREGHTCAFGQDGFNGAQKAVHAAGALCFISPVYWGEMAESLKCFFDRLRRCEFDMPWGAAREQKPALSGKPVLLVATPGGSGNGALSCLEQMERFCRHTGALIFDHIGVNRWNSGYQQAAAYAAARAMAGGRQPGETFPR
jgi:multimeric flavodoxin WrbA